MQVESDTADTAPCPQAAGLPYEALRQEDERHYFCETLKMHAESLSSVSGAPGKAVKMTGYR